MSRNIVLQISLQCFFRALLLQILQVLTMRKLKTELLHHTYYFSFYFHFLLEEMLEDFLKRFQILDDQGLSSDWKKVYLFIEWKESFLAKLDIVLWCSKYGRMMIFGTLNVCFCMIHSSCARNINALGCNYNYSLNDLRFFLLVLFQYDDFFPQKNISCNLSKFLKDFRAL